MERHTVSQKLTAILEKIQDLSGLECPLIGGETRPAVDLPAFDSKMWPVATGMLAVALGASIPNDMNVFWDKRTKAVRTMDEIAELVCDFLNQSASIAAE